MLRLRPGGDVGETMHQDPRFWALTVAIWLGLVLALENIYQKIVLFQRLTE